MSDDTKNILLITDQMTKFFDNNFINIAYPVSHVINESKQQYSMTWSANGVRVKGGVSHFTIYNAYEQNSATVRVSDGEMLKFNTHDELINILKKIFCWEAGDPEDGPDPREIHNWVRRFCVNHNIQGVHLRQMDTSNILNSCVISYDVSALNLENSITALIISKHPDNNEVFIQFNNEIQSMKFTDMNGLFFILKRKLKPETTVQNSKPQIWSSLCQLTSLLEEVQASQYKLATSANERNGESCDAAILGRGVFGTRRCELRPDM